MFGSHHWLKVGNITITLAFLYRHTTAHIINIGQAHPLCVTSKAYSLHLFCRAKGGIQLHQPCTCLIHLKANKSFALVSIWQWHTNSSASTPFGIDRGRNLSNIGREQDDKVIGPPNKWIKCPTLYHFKGLQLFTVAMPFADSVRDEFLRIVKNNSDGCFSVIWSRVGLRIVLLSQHVS